MIVADTNLVAYSVIPGSHDRDVARVRAADHQWTWTAPQILRSELLSVLARHMARGRMDRDEALRTFHRGMSFVLLSDTPTDAVGVLNLCQTTGCSSYDAEFVWLARERGLPLVTADQEVLAAFPETAVSYAAFVQA